MKYCKGMICSVDPKNVAHQDAAGVSNVKLVKRIKRRPLGGSIWLCENLEDSIATKTYRIQERLLSPANMSIIRWPIDTPIINSNDLKALAGAIRYLENLNSSNDINSLKALYDKLEFYNKFREV